MEVLIKEQRDYFKSQETKSIAFRKKQLRLLKVAIQNHEDEICDALYKDFQKPVFESLVSETQIILGELEYMLKNLDSWTVPKRIRPILANFPSRAKLIPEPLGSVLIIAPWNYPFQLAMAPLLGAVAAGNTVLLKPSELAPNTAKIIEKIIVSVFSRKHVALMAGGADTAQKLLKYKWDYIFFTGSTKVGKIVYQAAAEHMTPVTLELGGKNPCVVDGTGSLTLAAKRIVWGKFLNAGQSCVAPDLVFIQSKHKMAFVTALQKAISDSYGNLKKPSKDLARIISDGHFGRLQDLLINQTVILGGFTDASIRYISPTIIDSPSWDSPLMKEEIFGPLLPLVTYEEKEDLEQFIEKLCQPISAYIFSKDKDLIRWFSGRFTFGGGAVNDIIVQFANKRLPFGGVGSSGIGAYHGKASFSTFSHYKSMVARGTWLDIPLRYAPYWIPLKWVKKIRKLY